MSRRASLATHRPAIFEPDATTDGISQRVPRARRRGGKPRAFASRVRREKKAGRNFGCTRGAPDPNPAGGDILRDALGAPPIFFCVVDFFLARSAAAERADGTSIVSSRLPPSSSRPQRNGAGPRFLRRSSSTARGSRRRPRSACSHCTWRRRRARKRRRGCCFCTARPRGPRIAPDGARSTMRRTTDGPRGAAAWTGSSPFCACW